MSERRPKHSPPGMRRVTKGLPFDAAMFTLGSTAAVLLPLLVVLKWGA